MKLLKDHGFYQPAFLFLQVDTDALISDLIGRPEERTLYHELIHFCQDVTTTYGAINTSRFIDELKHHNRVARGVTDALELPVSRLEYSDAVRTNRDLFSIYYGHSADDYMGLPIDARVSNIISEDIEVEIGGRAEKMPVFSIKYDIGQSRELNFGSIAIMESMAHILEVAKYGDEHLKKCFPYDSAEMIAKHLYPHIGSIPRAVAEICEAALMFFHPAQLFIDALKRMRAEGFSYDRSDQAYEFCISRYSLGGQDALSTYRKQAQDVSRHLDDVITSEAYIEEKWASGLINRGAAFREKRSTITTMAWRSSLIDLMRAFGCPVIFNKHYDAWVQASNPPLKTPLLYPAVFTAYKLFTSYDRSCALKEYCKRGGAITDATCDKAPWMRKNPNGQDCYFTALWRMWGFSTLKITTRD